jgi:homoserine kinase type II
VQLVNPGNNNLSYAVSTPGEQYILRIYQNTAQPDRIDYEHTLLMRLDHLGLSFSVPAPISTFSGRTSGWASSARNWFGCLRRIDDL